MLKDVLQGDFSLDAEQEPSSSVDCRGNGAAILNDVEVQASGIISYCPLEVKNPMQIAMPTDMSQKTEDEVGSPTHTNITVSGSMTHEIILRWEGTPLCALSILTPPT